MKYIDFLTFYKYCPRCGGETDKRGENLVVCVNSHRIYINPRPTNAVIFENSQGQILLVRRKFEPYINMWDLPGGFVDLGENVEESALREVKEELGVSADELRYIGSTHDNYEYDGAFYPTICMTYTAKIPATETIQITDDVSGYKYFDRNKVPFDGIGFPSMRKAIEKYLSQ